MRINRISFVILIIFCDIVYCTFNRDIEKNSTIIAKEIEKWVKMGRTSIKFRGMMHELAIPGSWQRVDWTNFVDDVRGSVLCTMCQSVTKSVINLRRGGTSVEKLEESMTNLCILLNVQTDAVCRGVVRLNLPIFLYIIDNDRRVNHNDVCGLVLQNQDCSSQPRRYQWKLQVNQDKKQTIKQQISNENFKILQVTDIHYDPLYEPNGNADCNEPTCCRMGQNKTSENKKLAGYWGDFNNCDSPWHAVIDALDQMKSQKSEFDFVYFTGDIIDHGIWETSREANNESLRKIFKEIIDDFEGTPVYPILGNHEPHPLNLFSPDSIDDDELSTKWLYKLLADIWIDAGWLPESTRKTIQRGGYYTVVPKKGFRIISLNNNIAYIFNWWLIYEPRDPNGQLKWFHDVLLEAEAQGEKVHVLAHVPGGSSHSQHTWSREYNRIINRFSHIIAAQFNGHTHNDELNLIYDPSDMSRVTNVAWNGGSVTPYAFLNPNYKVYTVNAASYGIEDVDTWIYDLTEANSTPEKRPSWFKSYSFKKEYHLQDLSYESLHNWITNMASNTTIQQQYRRNFYKHAAPELDKECDEKCLNALVCQIVTRSSIDKSECKYFNKLNQ